jgi:nucleotide-binding universal stress UspA family protein
MKTTMEISSRSELDRTAPGHVLAAGTVLVPMLNLGVATDLIQLAGILASPPSANTSRTRSPRPFPSPATGFAAARVVVVGVVEVPPDQPLTTGLVMARSYRALLDFLPSEVEVAGTQVRVDRIVKVARDVSSAVHEAAADEQAGLVLLYWKGYARNPKRHVYGRIADAILRNPPCDVALVRSEGWRDSRRILLPVRGGPAAERALRLALALGEYLHLPISVMHNVPQGEKGHRNGAGLAEARGEEPYIVFNEYLKDLEQAAGAHIERILSVGGDPAASLLAEAHRSDLVIMGTPPPPGRGESPSSGPITLKMSEEKGPPLLLLRAPEPLDFAHYRRKARMYGAEEPAARRRARASRKSWDDMPFENWFVENTFHGDEFKDPEAFLEAKRRSGLSISVALLTSNDGDHIYSTITGLNRVLVEMHPIADQIAVIDAGSSDGTPEIARSLGVEVYSSADLLAGKGNLHGRGESWWKSLSVLRGDVIVWLDPRARRFHPSTAMCLAGPLLRVPTLQLVKAYGPPERDKLAEGKRKARPVPGRPDGNYAPVDMSWGGFVMPRPDADHLSSRIRVQALRPEDLHALDPAQVASLPPRTILQVLSPSLAAVIAPFGRDMAGRREAMLSLPAFIGGNFEVGLLLSVAAEYGTRSIAQVELRHARPAPPPQPGLRGAIDLLQALSRRLHDPGMRRRAAETAERLQKSIEGEAATPGFEVRALGPVERPPMQPILQE